MELLPHQKEGIEFLTAHHYAILGDAMGLGKTLQALKTIEASPGSTIVICPAMLTSTWKAEIKKFSIPGEIKIISYGALEKAEKHFKTARNIIADECHYLKNPLAQRTKIFFKYIQDYRPHRVIGLTGTAIKNRVGEFFTLISLCSQNPLGTSGKSLLRYYPGYFDFCRKFSNEKRFKIHGRQVVKFEGHRNVEELKTFLKDKYLRRKASQVLNLPPLIRKDILLNTSAVDEELLQAWEQANIKKSFIISKVNHARVKVRPTSKYVKDLLDQGEGPVIVFTDHVIPAEELGKALYKNKPKVITGNVSIPQRDKIIEQFQAGEVPVLVATIGSLSVGVTLTASRNIVFNDLPWVPGDIAQAEKRIHRIGQDEACVVHRIFWGNVDAYIGKQLDSKLKTLGEIL